VGRPRTNHTTAILAVRRADVVALNNLVRARRHAGGELGESMRFGTKAFRVGDRVLFEKNQRVAEAGNRAGRSVRLQVRNGTFGTVVGGVDRAGNAPIREGDVPEPRVTLPVWQTRRSKPRRPRLSWSSLTTVGVPFSPASYVEKSTSLGYALTVFRSRGSPSITTFGLGGDSLFQEAGYTQLSRGRLSTTSTWPPPRTRGGRSVTTPPDTAQRDALQSLVSALMQSGNRPWPGPSHGLVGPSPRTSTPPTTSISLWPDGSATRLCPTSPTPSPRPPTRRTAPVSLAGTRGLRRRRCQPSSPGNAVATSGWRPTETRSRPGPAWRATVRRYEYRLGQAASYTQPEHVTALLGPLPERVGHVERWQSAAGSIEAYRTRWSINGPVTLGPEPADPEQRAHWDTTVAMVGAAGFLNARDTREGGSERASLATRWENLHTANREPDDDRSIAESPIPSPASLWTDEPDLDYGLDDGFSL